MTKPEHDRWYKTARWQRRRRQQLERDPLCWMCKRDGRVTLATIANHKIPHRGDPELFWHGELDSLCKPHHDGEQQSVEKGGGGKPIKPTIGIDGWPTGG
jgi:5-methylcytosine-specific restriction protein A